MFSFKGLLVAFTLASSLCTAAIYPEKRDIADDIRTKLKPQLSANATVVFGGEPTFPDLTSRYSRWKNPSFFAVVSAANTKDVEVSAKFAIAANRQFLVVNTGHSWTDYSSTKDALLIKVDALDTIEINGYGGTMTVGPGVQFGPIMSALHARGKQVPTGTCNCVGMVGATIGGGHGRLQGVHGLILDNLVSATVLLANGKAVTVSESSYPDLFWGLRGAGHNFGVVLNMTYRIYNQVNGGNYLDQVMLFEGKNLEAVFTATNKFTAWMPAEASVYILFYFEARINKPVVMLDLAYAGTKAKGEALFKKGFGHLEKLAIQKTSDMIPWGEFNDKSALGLPGGFCVRGQIVTTFNFGLKTYHTGDMRKLWDNWLKFTTDNPQFGYSLYLFESYPLHAVRNRDWAETAYPNRDVEIIALPMISYSDPKDEPKASAYLEENKKILLAHSGYKDPRVYVNYARGSEGYGSFYGYETWRQQRLSTLKKKYDPKGNFNQFNPIPTEYPHPVWRK